MYSIGRLCREFNLSRSTLLYYDQIGLLTASGRTEGNYRLYSEKDKESLSKICTFREAGVPLKQIKDILDSEGTNESSILEKRMKEINRELSYLRVQQKLIVEMLKGQNSSEDFMQMDVTTFLSILEAAGIEEERLDHIHIQFEKNSPDFHQLFLEFIGIEKDDIDRIREYYRQ